MAHIHDHPTDFVKKTFKGAITFSLGLSVFAFFMLDMLEKPVALIIVICPVLFLLLFL